MTILAEEEETNEYTLAKYLSQPPSPPILLLCHYWVSFAIAMLENNEDQISTTGPLLLLTR